MRIICPNCLAEYEVHTSAVPAPGRDVQCSNCGHGWFQPASSDSQARDSKPAAPPGPAMAAPRGDADAERPVATVAGAVGVPEPPVDEPSAERDEGDDAPDDTAPDAHQDAQDPADSPVTAPPRRIDEAVLNVLREEAEREARARRAEALEMETQTDLGLESAGAHGGGRPRRPVRPGDLATTPRPPRKAPGQTRARVSVLPGAAATSADPDHDHGSARPAADVAVTAVEHGAGGPAHVPTEPRAAPDTVTRRMRLPDIEEVTGTLRHAETAASAPDGQFGRAGKGSSGFRLGFLVVLLIAALALVLYALTPQIIAVLPTTEPVLTAFAGGVDAARLWLAQRVDALMQAVLARLT